MFAPHILMLCLLSATAIKALATNQVLSITNADEKNTEASSHNFDEPILQTIVEQTRWATISSECAADLNITYNGIHERRSWAIASEC